MAEYNSAHTGPEIDAAVSAVKTKQSTWDNKQDKITGKAGQVVGFDASGNPIAQEAPSGGGASSWNDLKDKPVIIEGGDTLTWDGNTDGLVSADDMFYKVSDAAPTLADFASGYSIKEFNVSTNEERDSSFDSTAVSDFGGGLICSQDFTILVALEDNVSAGAVTLPEKGLYFNYIVEQGVYISSLTIPSYTGFAQEKIDPAYIPEHKHSYIVSEGGDTLTWDGNTEGLVNVDGFLYKISNATPSMSDFSNGAVSYATDTPEGTEVVAEELEDGIILAGSAFIVPADGATTEIAGTFPEKGTYFMKIDGAGYITAFTIPGYTGFAQEKIAPSHLYQPDWNQTDESAPDYVKNRPFGYVIGDTLDWDGNVEGLEKFAGMYYKVSDAVPTLAEVSAGGSFVMDGESIPVVSELYGEMNGVAYIGTADSPLVYFVEDDDVSATGASKGTYLLNAPEFGLCVSSVTINGFGKYLGKKRIDESYLPDSIKPVQSDWSQTINSEKDYIKNKPFGEKATFDSQKLTFSKAAGSGVYFAFISREIFSVAGDRITVTFDGTEYECIVKASPSGGTELFAGNGSIHYGFTVAEDTGEPFCLVRNRAFETDIITHSTESSHVVSVTTAQKIAEKYLPPHTHSWNDLADKPFGDVDVVFLDEEALAFEGGYTSVDMKSFAPIGSMVNVVLDGTTYTWQVVAAGQDSGFGNLALLGEGEDTGESLCGVFAADFGGLILMSADAEASSHAVKITGKDVVKLPTDYYNSTVCFYVTTDGYLYLDVTRTTKATRSDVEQVVGKIPITVVYGLTFMQAIAVDCSSTNEFVTVTCYRNGNFGNYHTAEYTGS